MNYEKLYKEALERAKEYLTPNTPECVDTLSVITTIFPELKESEDEKVRKGIIELVKQSSEILNKKNQERMLVWLEKQSDETKIEALRTEYEKGRADALAECRFDYSNANIQQKDYAEQKLIEPALWHDVSEEPEEMREILCEWGSDDATWHDVAFYDSKTNKFRKDKMPIDNVTKWVYVDELLEKQGEQKVSYTTIVETGNGGINALVTKELYVDKTEQKPTWSEEDDAYKLFAISAVEDYYDEKNPLQKELVDWLKSLKERIKQWK